MGSRIMHLIIADRVSKQLKIEYLSEFLLGSIAPDATFVRKQKDESHFLEGNIDDGTRYVDFERFVKKYSDDIHNAFNLGYLTHLISDEVWLRQIYFKNDLKKRVDADPGLLEKWHSDFRKMNGRLVEAFHCLDLKETLAQSVLPEKLMDEIKLEDLQQFKEEALGDFTYKQEELLKDLEVYSWQEILAYIDAAADESVRVCLSVQQESAIT